MQKIKLNIQRFADGKVVIDTDLDSKGFKNGLDKMQSIAKTGFTAIAGTVGVVSTAIAGLVGKSVTMAGELEQNLGGAEAVFKSLGDSLNKMQIEFKNDDGSTAYFKSLEAVSLDAYRTMGLAQSDYLATINKMGSLMQGAGLDTQKSLQLSSQAMQRAADVASIMGIDTQMAMESIAGAAKGNFTMMDNLGVAMNATTIEAYAMSKGIKTSYAEMDNATKVSLAMEMFLEKTSYAMGNYEKENKTFAGSFSTLKAATSNFLSGAGGIEDVADALVSFGGILVESIGKMTPIVVEGLVTLIDTLVPQIPTLLQQLLPAILQGAISLINGLVEIFPAILQLIKDNLPTIVQGGISIVSTLITTLLDMLPDILEMGITLLLELVKGISEALPELIPTMVRVIMDMVNILLDNIDLIIEAGIELLVALIEGIMNALPELVARLPEIIIKITSTLIQLTPQLLSAALRIIQALANGLIKYIPEMVSRIPQIIKSMISAFGQGIKDFGNIGKNLMNGLWNGLKSTWEGLKNKVSNLAGSIVGKFKSVFGIHSPSRVFKDEIGKYLAQGVGVGFEDEIDSVYDDMQRTVDLETGKMSANVQASGTYQMAMAGLPTFNLVDNASNTTQLVVNGRVLAEVVNTENRNREVATA